MSGRFQQQKTRTRNTTCLSGLMLRSVTPSTLRPVCSVVVDN